MRYRIERRLVQGRTAKARLEGTKITESKFADDTALYAVNRQAVERVAVTFVAIAAGCGFSVSFEKTIYVR